MSGWFVRNLRDAPWGVNDAMGAGTKIEPLDDPFPQVGFTVSVLEPGQPNGLYHREANQEGFLVLQGECLLIVEGEELPLRTWDFFHCPGGTHHIFVGAGDGPCAILMVGSREGWPEGEGLFYPRDEVALRHRAGVEEETDDPWRAYASWPDWRPGRPDSWGSLPWAE